MDLRPKSHSECFSKIIAIQRAAHGRDYSTALKYIKDCISLEIVCNDPELMRLFKLSLAFVDQRKYSDLLEICADLLFWLLRDHLIYHEN